MIGRRRISIIEESLPSTQNKIELIEWLLKSLGIVGKRDKGDIPSKILLEIIELNKENKQASLEEISYRANVSKTTTYHHITKMVKCGLVVKTTKGYALKAQTLERTLDEIEHEIHILLRRIKNIAHEIDKEIL